MVVSPLQVGVHYKYIHRQEESLTKLSPCPLFISLSIMSMILSQRSSMPSHLERRTRYCRKTLQRSEAAWTRVSLMPSRSEEKTSGLRSLRISGNNTSLNIAVHSSWSLHVSSGDNRDRCSDEKARWRTSRHGLVHCVARAWHIGSQYADHATGALAGHK